MTHIHTPHALRRAVGAGLLAAGAAAAVPALAADDVPKTELRVGLYHVHFDTHANDLSGPFTPPGINIHVDDVNTPYLAVVQRLDTHWHLELAGGIPPRTRTYGRGPAAVGSVPFDGQEVATAKWFSPTVLVDYKFLDDASPWRPFVGAGINFTRFYDRVSTPAGDAVNGGPTRVRLTSSWGPAATAGVSYQITPRWSAVASLSMARVTSHYTSDTSGVVRQTTIHFNPQALVVAMGYAF